MLKKSQNQLFNLNKLIRTMQQFRTYAKMLSDAETKDKLANPQNNVNFQSKVGE